MTVYIYNVLSTGKEGFMKAGSMFTKILVALILVGLILPLNALKVMSHALTN